MTQNPGAQPRAAAPRGAPHDALPGARGCAGIFLFALFLRVSLFAAAHFLDGTSLVQFAELRDGKSYIAYAKALAGDAAEYRNDVYHQRAFPGFPAILAVLYKIGVPLHWSGVGVNWLASALVAVLVAVYFRSRRIGLAMACLPPSYLMYSSLTMTEPTLLVLSMLGLLAAGRCWNLPTGLSFGLAGVVRPMACFVALGTIAAELRRRRWVSAAVLAAAAVGVLAVAAIALHLAQGDALRSVRVYANNPQAYNGRLLGWPFQSLIMTPLHTHVAPWKIFYIWAHVLLVLAGCGLLVRRGMRGGSGDAETTLLAVWLGGNTAFALCVGHIWGFHEFHRFLVPALPPLLWAYEPWLPRRRGTWLVVAAACFGMALFGLRH